MNKDNFKRIISKGLNFPTNLRFTSSDNGLLKCNGKLVHVIPSLPIDTEDNPPVDLKINGIRKYSFSLSEADVLIFSFINLQTHKTNCVVIPKDELLSKLKDYHFRGDHLNLKLILAGLGLHECYNTGAEGFFMGLWVNDNRDFTVYYNDWSVFNG